jgi:glucose/arabinose dehydrogenase
MKASIACTAVWLALAATSAGAQTFKSSAGDLKVETVATGLSHPWAFAFLPEGGMLVTERPGRMRVVSQDGKLSPPLAGLPKVEASGQAGLLDLALDRDFANTRTIYFCYTYSSGGNAAVARAKLAAGDGARLEDVKTIFRQQGPGGSNNHGCRIAQGADGNLFVTLGDHFRPRDEAQNLAVHNGKIVRIAPDGTVPPDNPFVGKPGREAGNLELWPPQSAGPRVRPRDRKTVGAGARPAGWRRSKRDRQGQELRLAGDRLRHRLQRREDPREHP